MENENGHNENNEQEEIAANEISESDEIAPETEKIIFYKKNKLLTGGVAVLLFVVFIFVFRSCMTGDDTGKLMVNISPEEAARQIEGVDPGNASILIGQKLYFSIKKRNTVLGVTDISLVIERSIENKFIMYKRILFEVDSKFPELKAVIPGVYFSETGTYRVKVLLENDEAFRRTVRVTE